MILYFTGTGNSEYTARRIQQKTQDTIRNLFPFIRQHKAEPMHSQRPWVIVTPTYAWRIPRIVQEWLLTVELTGNMDIYFVMTCGGSIGNAADYLKRLCKKRECGTGAVWKLKCRKITLLYLILRIKRQRVA